MKVLMIMLTYLLSSCVTVMASSIPFVNGYLPSELIYTTVNKETLAKCVGACFFSPGCFSVGYHRKNSTCHLYTVEYTKSDSTWTVDNEWTLTNRKDWPQAMAGPCAGHTCEMFKEQCVPKGNTYICKPLSGMFCCPLQTRNWLHDINECLSQPCKNNGTCNDEVNGYTCSCDSAFKGKNCEEVRCYGHAFLRVCDGGSASQGRLEILEGGSWSTICYYNWHDDNANVTCKTLGFAGGYAIHAEIAFGEGTGPISNQAILCTGLETNIMDCSVKTSTMPCFHYDDVSVICK